MPGQDLSSAFQLSPNAPAAYNPYGQLNWQENGVQFNNPVAAGLRRYSTDLDRLTGSTSIGYRILPKLLLKANGGLNRQGITEKALTPLGRTEPGL